MYQSQVVRDVSYVDLQKLLLKEMTNMVTNDTLTSEQEVSQPSKSYSNTHTRGRQFFIYLFIFFFGLLLMCYLLVVLHRKV